MTSLLPTRLSAEDARRLTDEVKTEAGALWAKLKQLYDGKAHRALGYLSWGDYFEAEFKQSSAHGYRLLQAAKVQERMGELAHSPIGERLNEAQAREIAPLLRAAPAKWDEFVANLGSGDMATAKGFREALKAAQGAPHPEAEEAIGVPESALLPELRPWRRLDDLLQALEDAPQFGLLSYAPMVLTEATDAERSRLRVHLAGVRAWLDAFESTLSVEQE